MRFYAAVLALAAAAGSTFSAHAATAISENLTGTVSGASTTDTLGLFGPAGADLKGKTITIHYQYVKDFFNSSGTCRTHACTTDTSSGIPNTPGAVLIAITVNGKQVTYTSAHYGGVIFGNLSDNGFWLYADTTSFGLGYTGAYVYTSFSAPATFGSALSPTDQPVKNFNSDFVSIFTPTSDDLPAETLNFVVTGAAS